jgi:hypothetical protein
MLLRAVRPFGKSMLAAAALVTCLASPAAAQDDPNPGAITISGALDFSNAYMFRGIRQETEGLVMWPYLDVGLSLFSGEGSFKSFGVNFGTWNSLHANSPSGSDNPRNGKLWYESDFYTTFGFGFAGGVTAGVTYTAYVSPNDAFTTVKEVAVKVGWDDSGKLGKAAIKPYVLFARELDSSPGVGQADAGAEAGSYLELGVSPGYTAPAWSIAVPVKVGLSISDYYENPLTGEDEKFGYFSVGGLVTVPFTTMPTKLGTWNLHGGIELQKLGETTKVFLNDLDDDLELKSTKFIYTLGIGFSY